jgi:hypothetical protein
MYRQAAESVPGLGGPPHIEGDLIDSFLRVWNSACYVQAYLMVSSYQALEPLGESDASQLSLISINELARLSCPAKVTCFPEHRC